MAACALLVLTAAAGAAVLTPVAEIKGPFAFGWKALSPDGSRYAHAEAAAIGLTGSDGASAGRIALGSNPSLGGFEEPPLRWDESGEAIWLGWPEDGPAPARASLGGALTPIAAPDPGAQPLDGLFYVNGSGLAVASYASRWAADAAGPPTLAVIDLARNRLLASLRLDGEFPAGNATARFRDGAHRPWIVAARSLGDGSVRVAASFDAYVAEPWLMAWNSRGPVRLIRTRHARGLNRFAISPDGVRILVATSLGPNSGCPPHVPCPARPQTDVALALYDFDSGELVWERVEQNVVWLRPTRPVFSPDGRFAIVTMPYHAESQPQLVRGLPPGRLGIVSVADGRLVAEAATRSHNMMLQLMEDGRTLVVHAFDTSHHFRIDWDEAARIEQAAAQADRRRRRGRRRR